MAMYNALAQEFGNPANLAVLVAGRKGAVRVIDPDESLVQRMAQGDERALRLLMDRHLERILAFSRRMLRNPTESEDVAQEVFLRAWSSAIRWRPGNAKYETWLHRVAHNLCIDRLRRRRSVGLDALPEPEDPTQSAFDRIDERQTSERINRAIVRLPESQRAAISLCHSQGLGNIEAAQVLGVSVEALESLLARGRRRLRELLQHEVNDLLSRGK
jgi:RNA polymerase sigma-70 factor (ECF subfamily)